jgi:hypothetical protein
LVWLVGVAGMGLMSLLGAKSCVIQNIFCNVYDAAYSQYKNFGTVAHKLHKFIKRQIII